MPTAKRVFELSLHGLNLPALTIKVPELRLTAQLQPGTPLQLKVRVKDVREQQADALANKVAQTLYRRSLVRFGGRIDRSEPPWTASMVGKGTSKTFVVAPTIFNLSQREIDDLANDVYLRIIAEEFPPAGQLYTATDMYAAGLESQNKVVRFLVLYSALGLAALFKEGQGGGGQKNVDELIRKRNPSVSVSASPTIKNRTETLYTKLRNDLIHAEERGCDPKAAIAAIEKHIGDFQDAVSRVFSQL
jgi:hypothetical protein